MSYFYFGMVFASAIIFFLTALLLFLRRKEGERSRVLLSFITLLSVFNYLGRIYHFSKNPNDIEVLPISFLLLGIAVITTYIMYPIEVISPGRLNWKRVFYLYLPVFCIWVFYRITLLVGVEYSVFHCTQELWDSFPSFEVIFRFILGGIIFVPALTLYTIPYTKKYNNTDSLWMRRYVTAVMINTIGYLFVIIHDALWARTLYYAISTSCSLFIAYQELFVRLIRKPIEENTDDQFDTSPELPDLVAVSDDELSVSEQKSNHLFHRLEKYMSRNYAWRDPDLTITQLAKEMMSNRTTLREVIQQNGYSNYTTYINTKRIADFIRMMENSHGLSQQQIFYDVGYRCKSTALRNFKEVTGMIPSEYFKNKLRTKKGLLPTQEELAST